MTRYVIRRLIQSVFLLIGVATFNFVILHLAPGGPELVSEDPRLPKDYAAQQRRDLGLDQPLPVQYVRWIGQVARLNFGRSFIDKRPVTEKIVERMPNTLLLSGTSFIVGLLGIPLGIVAALRRGRPVDHGIRLFAAFGNAAPDWWVALIILLISARTVHWFPLGGTQTIGDGSLLDRLHHLLLPALIGGIGGWIGYSRLVRSQFLEVMNEDYVRTARAKGLAERRVIWSHVLRNAMLPVVTSFGGILTLALSGAVLFEYTFSWPGMGRLALEAATQRDYPVLMALTVISAALVIIGQLLVDVLYTFVDPRVKLT